MRTAFLVFLAGCGSYGITLKDSSEVGTDGSGTEPATAIDWSGATLLIESPVSGAFVPYHEPAPFSATVYAADGTATDFADIQWASDVDAAWAMTGAAFEDATLDVGVHTITATAELPNGDRLSSSVGGVLVQSPYAGVYSGEIYVVAAYDSYELSCDGVAELVIDAYGELASGSAECPLDFYGYYTMDTTYVLDLVNAGGELSGVAMADLVYATYDFSFEGDVSEDGEISGGFSDDVYGYLTIEGELSATRVTRDVSGY